MGSIFYDPNSFSNNNGGHPKFTDELNRKTLTFEKATNWANNSIELYISWYNTINSQTEYYYVQQYSSTIYPLGSTSSSNKLYTEFIFNIIETVPSSTLSIASASVLGGVKVGIGLTIDNTGVLSNNVIELFSDIVKIPNYCLIGQQAAETGSYPDSNTCM